MEPLFEQFIKERKYLRNLADKTLSGYREQYEVFRKLGAFEDLSKDSLQKAMMALRERGTSIGAINAYIRGVNCFLNWLHIEQNYPKLSLKLLKGNKRVLKSLSDEDLKAIVKYKPRNFSEKRLHVQLLLLIDTGLRVNESITLEKSKIDFENLLLSVTGKGNKERIVPFSYELRKILYKYTKGHAFELLFSTRDGRRVSYDNVLRDFYRLIRKLGVKPDGAFHAFRRTFATNYVRNGGNPLVLQRLLGHTTLQQTNLYVKLVTDDLQKEQHRTSLLNRIR